MAMVVYHDVLSLNRTCHDIYYTRLKQALANMNYYGISVKKVSR
jgi:hypothetical protein